MSRPVNVAVWLSQGVAKPSLSSLEIVDFYLNLVGSLPDDLVSNFIHVHTIPKTSHSDRHRFRPLPYGSFSAWSCLFTTSRSPASRVAG